MGKTKRSFVLTNLTSTYAAWFSSFWIFVRPTFSTNVLDTGRVASAHAFFAECLGEGVGLGGAGRVRVANRRHNLSRCYKKVYYA